MTRTGSTRVDIEAVVQCLHAARLRSDLAAMCELFSESGHYRIAGSSDGKPVAICAESLPTFRPWLSMLVKAFRIDDYVLHSLIVDGERAAAHWRATIYSKITGIGVETELVDLVTVQSTRIVAYTEFFVPA